MLYYLLRSYWLPSILLFNNCMLRVQGRVCCTYLWSSVPAVGIWEGGKLMLTQNKEIESRYPPEARKFWQIMLRMEESFLYDSIMNHWLPSTLLPTCLGSAKWIGGPSGPSDGTSHLVHFSDPVSHLVHLGTPPPPPPYWILPHLARYMLHSFYIPYGMVARLNLGQARECEVWSWFCATVQYN